MDRVRRKRLWKSHYCKTGEFMTKDRETDDYDSPWKEILEHYFREFIEFFFPDAYDDIDWEKGYEFLDKEFQQITADSETGKKYVDKLARVWLKTGSEVWALVHTDIQTGRESGFDERMYVYNYRIFDKFRIHAASFAIIGGKSPNWNPGVYENRLWGCEVRFRFPVVRLLDYADDTESLEKSDNPFAVVVLAHLKTEATAKDKKRRRREKFELVKNLHDLGFGEQDVRNLFHFIDWMMRLPEVENQLFWNDVKAFEKEKNMPYVTSVEKIGYKRGVDEGMQQGKSIMFSDIIAKKYGEPPDRVLQLIKPLTPEELEEMTDMFFELDSFDAFCKWVRNRTEKRAES
ncbi:MAG: cytosolic protein [Okeania sp. SIO3C4]|nr:cytosolic protein [Okeania sp. SIO3C4]